MLASLTVAAALIAPSTALAGGFATVGVSPPPDRLEPGTPWHVELEVLQHGRTPLDGVHPRVIVNRDGNPKEFRARATGRPGIYTADVVFPSAGTWNFAVDDGFTQTHTFPPIRVGSGDGVTKTAAAAPSAGGADDGGSGGGSDLPLALAIAGIAALAAALGATALRRRPRPESG
jgi:hypothetical protein